jgi:hypothetical protein
MNCGFYLLHDAANTVDARIRSQWVNIGLGFFTLCGLNVRATWTALWVDAAVER